MQSKLLVVFLRTVPFFAAVALVSAQPIFPETAPAATFRSEARLVVLNVSVIGADGKIVNNIPRSTFTVFENDEPQQITVFRQEDIPVSLGLVIDNSASMKEKRDRVAAAALAMIKASNPQDEVCVIHFNEEARLVQDFTGNLQQLESSLNKIQSSGETAMRDAVRLGIEHLRTKGRRDKKVLVVVTDGDDNDSIETLSHLVRAAQQSDVIVYGIGLLGSEEPHAADRARKALEELTSETGGRAWFPSQVADIARITPEIAHEIRNQYVIGYTPADLAADGSFRRLRVEVNYPHVQVRARSGYYAPRD
jgi:Ca-activated chloride channel homolog